MPESLLSRRLSLGTYAGIPLYVHWSFALAVLYVGLTSLDLGWAGVGFSIAQLFGVFFCVTLHEYGHAIAARRFGIGTADITLLPIGGVARLKKMPRIPWQELVVAVAGPAVNVVIAIVLGVFLALTIDPEIFSAIGTYVNALFLEGPITDETLMMIMDLLSQPSWIGFGLLLLFVNVMLVVFNMIPAFPMDGGRVFRSIMAMFMDYRRATFIASRVGLVCAAIMAMLALRSSPPSLFPLFIAAFIAYAGMAEARQVNVMETVRGLTVGEVMIENTPWVSMNMPVVDVIKTMRSSSLTSVPVISIAGTVVGMLSISDLQRYMRQGVDPGATAGELVDHGKSAFPILQSALLDEVLGTLDKHHRQVPVINQTYQLVGILDLDSMMMRAELIRAASTALGENGFGQIWNGYSSDHDSTDSNPYRPPSQFDATT
ncbi:site-2 protease family protein [Rubripirellula amarantea]|uniref:Putative zinc metalloprotease Rip3 n=1 Tax=Rubripirellula amarantea TaxID=2527999 RepID=A0A5C5WUT8_9BACT|nr:site-2 protease family protein [Rubripirellula amarantea]MDA8743999.1 site-2 protease family protein [Rubripirellula amarantea]TWT54330.1 putative zinc metalloprotease Rip3 [Rubripirellula amarantea]